MERHSSLYRSSGELSELSEKKAEVSSQGNPKLADASIVTGLQRLYNQLQPLKAAFDANHLTKKIEAEGILKAVVTSFERWRAMTSEVKDGEVHAQMIAKIDALELKALIFLSKALERATRVDDVVKDGKHLKAELANEIDHIKFYKKMAVLDILGFIAYEIDAMEDHEEAILLMSIWTQQLGTFDDFGQLTKQTGILLELAKQRDAGNWDALNDWVQMRLIFNRELDDKSILFMQKIASDANDRNVLELAMHAVQDEFMKLRQTLRHQAGIPDLMMDSPIITARTGLTDTDMLKHYGMLLDPNMPYHKGLLDSISRVFRGFTRFKISWVALAEYVISMKNRKGGGITELLFYLDKKGASFSLKRVDVVESKGETIGGGIYDIVDNYVKDNGKGYRGSYDYLAGEGEMTKGHQYPKFGTAVQFGLEDLRGIKRIRINNFAKRLVQNIWMISEGEKILPRKGFGKNQIDALEREIWSLWKKTEIWGYFGRSRRTKRILVPLLDNFARLDSSVSGTLAIRRFIDDVKAGKIQLFGIVKSDIHTIFRGKERADDFACFLDSLENVELIHKGKKKTFLKYLEDQMRIGAKREGILQNKFYKRGGGLKAVLDYLDGVSKRHESNNVFWHHEDILGLLGHAVTQYLMKKMVQASRGDAGPQARELAELFDKARRNDNWTTNLELSLSYAYDEDMKGAGRYAIDHIIAFERNDGKFIFLAIQDKVITNVKDFYSRRKTMNKVIANDFRKLYQWLEGLFNEMVGDTAAKMKDETRLWGRSGLLDNAPGGKKGKKKLELIEQAFQDNRVIDLYGMARYYEFGGSFRPLNGAGCGSQLKIYLDVFQPHRMRLEKHLTRLEESHNADIKAWVRNSRERIRILLPQVADEIRNTVIWAQSLANRSVRKEVQIAYQITGAINAAGTRKRFVYRYGLDSTADFDELLKKPITR